MTPDEKQAYIDRIAAEIGEHFDCVQILAHDSDTESYQTYDSGSGSLFARMYQAMQWSESPVDLEIEEEEEEED